MSGNSDNRRRPSAIPNEKPSYIQKPQLYQPELDFESGDFSSSHYNKIPADPKSFRNLSSKASQPNVKTIAGGFDSAPLSSGNPDVAGASGAKAVPIGASRNSENSSHSMLRKESMLSQSLRGSSIANDYNKKNDSNNGPGKLTTIPSKDSKDKSIETVSDAHPEPQKNSTTTNANSKYAPSIKTANSNSVSTNNNTLAALAANRTPRPSINVDAENPNATTLDIVARHLVNDEPEFESPNAIDNSYSNSVLQSNTHNNNNNPPTYNNNYGGPGNTENDNASSVIGGEEFDSLQLQGGDITREIYNWKRDHTRAPRKVKSFSTISRTGSFSSFSNLNVPTSNNSNSDHFNHNSNYGSTNYNTNSTNISEPDLNVSEILLPGGFRRSFIAQKHAKLGKLPKDTKPTFFTRNFIEFLTLYGHFAGEEFSDEEDEEGEEESHYEGGPEYSSEDFTEHDRLLQRDSRYKPQGRVHHHHPEAKVSTFKAVLLLLKAFIGTGILFLPKGFYNGGILFSLTTLVFFSSLSYWCFLLLIDTKIKSNVSSFGDIGEKYFGSKMRVSILASVVLSQIGFASAYIVFVAQNLRSVIIAITGQDSVSIPVLIFAQLLIFIPLSLTRKIAKLSGTALVADFFILLGILYIYYNSTFEIIVHHFKKVEWFNPNDWTIFIGTAVFTYEGIGLLIPIQESMKKPSKFTGCLGGVMIGITFVFVSIGAICYLAYGANVQTVILNNFPQDSSTVNIIQLLYAFAILLSTPLQLFPAIRILENAIFGAHKSGKFNTHIKWKKNFFRIALVIATSLISWVGNSDLDKFVALIGSFACIPLIYIYPPMLHIKSYTEEIHTGNAFPADRNYMLNNHVACYFNVVVLLFGAGIMAYTSIDTIQSWIF